ncbi:MAG: argininosuccinate lyase [Bacillota bacterium]
MSKLWGGRFSADGGQRAEEFTSSLSFDKRLYRQDIQGSEAHARMLARQGIISEEECALIIGGLRQCLSEIERGEFPFRQEFEDIHLNIEQRLTEIIGPAGRKLHTGRSRNDQVTLDMHLYIRSECQEVLLRLRSLQQALVDRAAEHLGVIMPGFTHFQHAQPVLFSHYLMAYFWMFQRDAERLAFCLNQVDRLPLGAAALAGTTYPLDPSSVARELGFTRLYDNSIDAVSDRDYLLEFLFSAAVMGMHMSRLAEELVVGSSREFSFYEMDDAFATGSSIMPQKKNPDVCELLRGKSGRLIGNLVSLLVVLKGLPLAYNSDMQEDKEAVFDSVDTVKACLSMLTGVISTMKLNPERMRESMYRDFCLATELADYLAQKGIAFRDAHHIAGRAVAFAVNKGVDIWELTLSELRAFSDVIDEDVYDCLNYEVAIQRRTTPGGTSRENVEQQIAKARALLEAK